MNSIVTRFAPSPTGNLHIGGVRTALINYIVAKKNKKKFPNSKFLIRIEDTDKKRSNEEFKQNILKGLSWLKIIGDGNPYIQSSKIKRHVEVAYDLLKKNKAFKCICTIDELEKIRKENRINKISSKKLCKSCEKDKKIQLLKKDFTIRIKIPEEGNSKLYDRIQGEIIVENKEIDDFILLRRDGTPTYMLSVVVDDYDMGVNYIIRGDDHLNNVFRQNFIYNNLKWKLPKYAHLPLIHGEDGKKLSKRHGAVDINEFKQMGYLKESIINNLILLGWSPSKKEEYIEIDEIIDLFDIKKISKSSSIFSYDKLNFFNNFYIRKNNLNELYNYCKINEKLNIFLNIDEVKLLKIFSTYQNKLNNYKDLEKICIPYYELNLKTLNIVKYDENFNALIKDFVNILQNIEKWEIVILEKLIKKFIEDKEVKFIKFGKPMRLILINMENGPSISEILYILDKKNSINRIKNYINDI